MLETRRRAAGLLTSASEGVLVVRWTPREVFVAAVVGGEMIKAKHSCKLTCDSPKCGAVIFEGELEVKRGALDQPQRARAVVDGHAVEAGLDLCDACFEAKGRALLALFGIDPAKLDLCDIVTVEITRREEHGR